ncbi:BgTH12-07822 [Blumeria graminis f. sp. triticale]|uniref:Bgt-51741 n=2 Tax=Blumeria graminis TaxID=34373 RepID=A0A9X9MQA5_BLUGR|nr:BgTH12-07822 [Blumeria graminis f. sp. triticale]VDB96456.1 Bgt-51741 [Blumeria graminis f. sp. tritici]
MKFLNTASIAALAGLSLLVPAVYGVIVLDCGEGAKFPETEINEYLKLAGPRGMRADDPPYLHGNIIGAYRMTVEIRGNPRTFLIQRIDEIPYYRFFEITSGHKECPIGAHGR